MIGTTLARYEILDRIGTGGMGDVFLALDTELQRRIALKVLPTEVAADPTRLARFRNEACALAALNHPRIVVIHSVEEAGGVHFMTMELVEGRDLATVLAVGPLALDSVFKIALQTCEALVAAHVQGVTHRDLKPANVMVSDGGDVKLLDFGLAKFVDRRDDRRSSSATETLLSGEKLLGTPDYMAPEQVRGAEPEPAVDQFSLGVILYEMITGRRPFTGDTVPELFASILRDVPEPPQRIAAACPAALGHAVLRCLAKEPSDRFASVRAAHDELQAIRARVDSGAREPFCSIAVLPFADLSGAGDQRHFCDGVAEEIINALAHIPGLGVASRMSSFQYRDAGGDSRDIGRDLGVQYLLEGSVRREGEALRIMTQLIDAADGYHVWSHRYDREFRDVFAVQEEIAHSIVQTLQVKLGPAGARPLVETRTDDPAAYDQYLKGRDFFRRWGKRNVEIAQRMFMRAVELDGTFASAHAGMADAHCYLFMYIDSSGENLQAADSWSARALELDSYLAEAHASRGLFLSLDRRHDEAEREFLRAAELDPHLFEARYFHARDCVVQGRYEEAVELYAKAGRISPDDYQVPILTAQIHHSLGREAEELEANRRGLVLAEKAILLNPEDARACYMGAGAMIRLGQTDRGYKWALQALAIDPYDPAILYNVACSYALTGRIDEAVDCLERTVRAGASYKEWMENDSDLDPLRDHERFRALLEDLA